MIAGRRGFLEESGHVGFTEHKRTDHRQGSSRVRFRRHRTSDVRQATRLHTRSAGCAFTRFPFVTVICRRFTERITRYRCAKSIPTTTLRFSYRFRIVPPFIVWRATAGRNGSIIFTSATRNTFNFIYTDIFHTSDVMNRNRLRSLFCFCF